MAGFVKARQQGFLRGRSIIQNLLDVDTASMHTSLMHKAGACVLFEESFEAGSELEFAVTVRSSSAVHVVEDLGTATHVRITGGVVDGTVG